MKSKEMMVQVLDRIAERLDEHGQATSIDSDKLLKLSYLAHAAEGVAVGGAIGTAIGGVASVATISGLLGTSLFFPGVGTLLGMAAGGALLGLRKKYSQSKTKTISKILESVEKNPSLKRDIIKLIDSDISRSIVLNLVEIRILIELTNLPRFLKDDAISNTFNILNEISNKTNERVLLESLDSLIKIVHGYPRFTELISDLRLKLRI